MTANKQIGWSQEAILLHGVSKQLERLASIIGASGGGGGTTIPTDLTYTASATNGLLTSSTGVLSPATIPLVTGSLAGLMSPTSFNKLAALPATVPVTTVYTLSALMSSIVTNRVAVPGWSFPVTAGKKYKIEISALYQTAAATTGGSIGVVLTSGTGTIQGYLEGDVSTAAAVATGLRGTISAISSSNGLAGSSIFTTGSASINTPTYMGGILTFTCITSGQFEVQFATEIVSSAAQLNAGSIMIVTEY